MPDKNVGLSRQDFAHIMIALAVPCRYISGYLFQEGWDRRSIVERRDARVGFDPTNDLVAGDRHIRVALGRDYADVPPTAAPLSDQDSQQQ